jgi:hypothetical protein
MMMWDTCYHVSFLRSSAMMNIAPLLEVSYFLVAVAEPEQRSKNMRVLRFLKLFCTAFFFYSRQKPKNSIWNIFSRP